MKAQSRLKTSKVFENYLRLECKLIFFLKYKRESKQYGGGGFSLTHY